MAGVLNGLTVIDLSQGVAGPMTGMVLCDQGARVVKVEPRGGDPTRSLSGARVWHRGKESIELDLESSKAQTTLRELVRRADVLITSASPEVRQRLGFAYRDVDALNPGLVYCSITAYDRLERHAGRPAIDALVAARTGLQWEKRGWPGGSIERINGIEPFIAELGIGPSLTEGPERDGPLFSAIPWPSVSAFYLATIGISAALHVREATGLGQLVETSLLQGALVNGLFTWQRIQKTQAEGYRMWVTDPRVPHGFFETADDHWVQQWVPQPSFALSAPSGIDGSTEWSGPASASDERTGMGPEEIVVLREYLASMRSAFRRFTADDWEERAAVAGLSVQRIRSPEEALSSQTFLEDGCVVEVDDGEYGPIRHVGVTYRLSRCPVAIDKGAPSAGRDNEKVRQELLSSATSVTRPAATVVDTQRLFGRGPLTGVLVLDLGLAVAGPFGTQVLADLGADVIKVNQESDRDWADLCMGMACNRGKRSIILNLKSKEGLDVLRKMVRTADVLHSNMHMDSLQRLGVDYESLRVLNPRLIYCHTRGFENGPRINLVGHDQSGSAIAGVAWEESGMYDGGRPMWPNISLGDTGNGMLSAAAVIQALYHRDRTGEGQLVETSIAYVQLLNGSSTWIKRDGTMVARPVLDREHYGLGPLYRLYKTNDDWLCLAVQSQEQWERLAAAIDKPELAQDERFRSSEGRADHGSELARELQATLMTRRASEWLARFDDADVPAEISSSDFALSLFDDPEMVARGFVVKHPHRRYGHVEMLGRLVDFSMTPGSIERGALVPGQESREVLRGFGFSAEEVSELIRGGAVSGPEYEDHGPRADESAKEVTA
jgi:crotonobetainyl-CoA:carnitine CoA-transferase CaiB-like acyl-CoA transferase